MKKNYNYKVVFVGSNNENPNVIFAVSKTISLLEKLNIKLNSEALVVATAINSSILWQDRKSMCVLFLQINLIGKVSIETIITELNKLLDTVSDYYKLEQVKIEILED